MPTGRQTRHQTRPKPNSSGHEVNRRCRGRAPRSNSRGSRPTSSRGMRGVDCAAEEIRRISSQDRRVAINRRWSAEQVSSLADYTQCLKDNDTCNTPTLTRHHSPIIGQVTGFMSPPGPKVITKSIVPSEFVKAEDEVLMEEPADGSDVETIYIWQEKEDNANIVHIVDSDSGSEIIDVVGLSGDADQQGIDEQIVDVCFMETSGILNEELDDHLLDVDYFGTSQTVDDELDDHLLDIDSMGTSKAVDDADDHLLDVDYLDTSQAVGDELDDQLLDVEKVDSPEVGNGELLDKIVVKKEVLEFAEGKHIELEVAMPPNYENNLAHLDITLTTDSFNDGDSFSVNSISDQDQSFKPHTEDFGGKDETGDLCGNEYQSQGNSLCHPSIDGDLHISSEAELTGRMAAAEISPDITGCDSILDPIPDRLEASRALPTVSSFLVTRKNIYDDLQVDDEALFVPDYDDLESLSSIVDPALERQERFEVFKVELAAKEKKSSADVTVQTAKGGKQMLLDKFLESILDENVRQADVHARELKEILDEQEVKPDISALLLSVSSVDATTVLRAEQATDEQHKNPVVPTTNTINNSEPEAVQDAQSKIQQKPVQILQPKTDKQNPHDSHSPVDNGRLSTSVEKPTPEKRQTSISIKKQTPNKSQNPVDTCIEKETTARNISIISTEKPTANTEQPSSQYTQDSGHTAGSCSRTKVRKRKKILVKIDKFLPGGWVSTILPDGTEKRYKCKTDAQGRPIMSKPTEEMARLHADKLTAASSAALPAKASLGLSTSRIAEAPALSIVDKKIVEEEQCNKPSATEKMTDVEEAGLQSANSITEDVGEERQELVSNEPNASAADEELDMEEDELLDDLSILDFVPYEVEEEVDSDKSRKSPVVELELDADKLGEFPLMDEEFNTDNLGKSPVFTEAAGTFDVKNKMPSVRSESSDIGDTNVISEHVSEINTIEHDDDDEDDGIVWRIDVPDGAEAKDTRIIISDSKTPNSDVTHRTMESQITGPHNNRDVQVDVQLKIRRPSHQGRHQSDEGRCLLDEGKRPSVEARCPSVKGMRLSNEGRCPSDQLRRPSDKGRCPSNEGRHPLDDGRRPSDARLHPLDEVVHPSDQSGRLSDKRRVVLVNDSSPGRVTIQVQTGAEPMAPAPSTLASPSPQPSVARTIVIQQKDGTTRQYRVKKVQNSGVKRSLKDESHDASTESNKRLKLQQFHVANVPRHDPVYKQFADMIEECVNDDHYFHLGDVFVALINGFLVSDFLDDLVSAFFHYDYSGGRYGAFIDGFVAINMEEGHRRLLPGQGKPFTELSLRVLARAVDLSLWPVAIEVVSELQKFCPDQVNMLLSVLPITDQACLTIARHLHNGKVTLAFNLLSTSGGVNWLLPLDGDLTKLQRQRVTLLQMVLQKIVEKVSDNQFGGDRLHRYLQNFVLALRAIKTTYTQDTQQLPDYRRLVDLSSLYSAGLLAAITADAFNEVISLFDLHDLELVGSLDMHTTYRLCRYFHTYRSRMNNFASYASKVVDKACKSLVFPDQPDFKNNGGTIVLWSNMFIEEIAICLWGRLLEFCHTIERLKQGGCGITEPGNFTVFIIINDCPPRLAKQRSILSSFSASRTRLAAALDDWPEIKFRYREVGTNSVCLQGHCLVKALRWAWLNSESCGRPEPWSVAPKALSPPPRLGSLLQQLVGCLGTTQARAPVNQVQATAPMAQGPFQQFGPGNSGGLMGQQPDLLRPPPPLPPMTGLPPPPPVLCPPPPGGMADFRQWGMYPSSGPALWAPHPDSLGTNSSTTMPSFNYTSTANPPTHGYNGPGYQGNASLQFPSYGHTTPSDGMGQELPPVPQYPFSYPPPPFPPTMSGSYGYNYYNTNT